MVPYRHRAWLTPRFQQSLMLLVPALTVVVVALSWLVFGGERVLLGARVYVDGPPLRALALRIRSVEKFGGVERPYAGLLVLRLKPRMGRALELAAEADESGDSVFNRTLEDELPLPAQLELLAGQRTLASTVWQVRPRSPRVQRGGWLEPQETADIQISVGVMSGVLAVPFPAQLVIGVTRGGLALAGAKLKLEASGARLAQRELQTDERGQAKLALTPLGFRVELVVHAAHPRGRARFYGVLPVVPGAIRASLRDQRLVVKSPIARADVFVSVVNEHQTLLAHKLQLSPITNAASFAWPETFKHEPLWVVTSSEYDLQSMALVGWPLGGDSPRPALNVRPSLLVDGIAQAELREGARLAALRRLTVALVGAGLVLELLLMLLLVRRSRQELHGRLHEHGLATQRHSHLGSLTLALVCVGLGYAALVVMILAHA